MSATLAPFLGRLAAPPRGGPFEAIRLALVDRLIAARAEGRLDGREWVAAWEAAVTAIRDQVIDDGTAALRRAAVQSRYPAALLQQQVPDPEAAERLLQRLLAEGIPLERLEGEADTEATLRRRGAALEAAWDAVVRLARVEAGRLATDAERVMGWRRSWRPVVITGMVLVSLAVVASAMIGGLLPAPAWLQPVVDGFWGLPWP